MTVNITYLDLAETDMDMDVDSEKRINCINMQEAASMVWNLVNVYKDAIGIEIDGVPLRDMPMNWMSDALQGKL